jgi:hypothetical protein
MNWLKRFLCKIWLPKTARRIALLRGTEYAQGKYYYKDGELFLRYKRELTNYNAEIIDPEIIEVSVSKDFRQTSHMVYQCIEGRCKKLDYSDTWVRQLLEADKDLPK